GRNANQANLIVPPAGSWTASRTARSTFGPATGSAHLFMLVLPVLVEPGTVNRLACRRVPEASCRQRARPPARTLSWPPPRLGSRVPPPLSAGATRNVPVRAGGSRRDWAAQLHDRGSFATSLRSTT